MPEPASPSLHEYSLPELEALLISIREAIAAKEEADRRGIILTPYGDSTGAAFGTPPAAPSAASDHEDGGTVAAATPAPPAVSSTGSAGPAATAIEAVATAVEVAPVEVAPVIKYMHPSNRNMTWTGEGEQPEWIGAYLAQGGSWIALQNAAEKLAPRRR